ncbi:MAG: cyclic nucleotide-binding domain-containing protein [bacterium]|nr:cyclic nucleotide-binding domain-containing protein [bacterium]
MPDSLQKVSKKAFKAGDIIFNQGDVGTEMYVVEKGLVEVMMATEQEKVVSLGEIGPNNFFGEMALFGDNRRIATAKALENTRVVVINGQIMKSQLSKLPNWFISMFKALIERLRETDRLLIEQYEVSKEE